MRYFAAILIAFIGAAGLSAAQQTDYRPTDIKRFPTILIDAVIAAQDPDFGDHQLWRSPITAQVIRMQQSTNGNDHWDMIMSGLWLDWEYSDNQIMALYLNTAYFGQGCFGAAAAVLHLYGKDLPEINTTQAIMLAALLDRPTGYGDDVFMQRNSRRIATEMLEMGLVDAAQAARTTTEIPRRNIPLGGC